MPTPDVAAIFIVFTFGTELDTILEDNVRRCSRQSRAGRLDRCLSSRLREDAARSEIVLVLTEGITTPTLRIGRDRGVERAVVRDGAANVPRRYSRTKLVHKNENKGD